MEAIHTQAGSWRFMLHGNVFLRYTNQDVFDSGGRGDSEFGSINWFMGMAQRPLGRNSQLSLRGMFSLDPLTEGGGGYPLLFQTGETFEGEPLIDRQHPHDLFTELSVTYGQALGAGGGLFVYAGFPGEPALGPPAFMHRPSALHNPDSPLGHHWQDATHIVFGVATVGLRYGRLQLDGSVFTGREPDEARFGFDRPRFDSYSARLSAAPADYLTLQVSRGFLRSPESLEPDEDQWRTMASLLYNRPLSPRSNWATTLLWGLNESTAPHEEDGREDAGHGRLHSVLLESDLVRGPQAFYTRAEWVQKSALELGLQDLFEADRTFNIQALTLGAARDLARFGSMKLMLGAQGILYGVPERLQPLYGERPVSVEVYLRLSPTRMRMDHSGMPMHHNSTRMQQD